MVRPDDSQTGHSVTRLAAEVEDCPGPRKRAHENTARESVISSKHHKSLSLQVKVIFLKLTKLCGERQTPNSEGGKEVQLIFNQRVYFIRIPISCSTAAAVLPKKMFHIYIITHIITKTRTHRQDKLLGIQSRNG